MFLRSLVKLTVIILFQSGILLKIKKQGLRRILDLSPEFRISCCQVGITCQKAEEARHILPPSVLDPRGRRPAPPPKLTPMSDANQIFQEPDLLQKGQC